MGFTLNYTILISTNRASRIENKNTNMILCPIHLRRHRPDLNKEIKQSISILSKKIYDLGKVLFLSKYMSVSTTPVKEFISLSENIFVHL